MGIPRSVGQLIINEGVVRPLHGAVLTLGRQHIYFTMGELLGMFDGANFSGQRSITVEKHREPSLRAKGYISDDTFWAALGFSTIVRADVSNYENVDLICDLNAHSPPTDAIDRFDLIFDGGTLEHIFDARQALQNLHTMLRVGGRIVHCSPTSNCLDHGFFCFSPTFFADFYAANGYRIHQIYLCRRLGREVNSAVELYDYFQPTGIDFEMGTLDRHIYYTWVVVEKLPTSTGHVIPQQSFYAREWAKRQSPSVTIQATGRESKAEKLLRWTSRSPLLHRVANWGIAWWRSRIYRLRRLWIFPRKFVGKLR